MADRLLGIEQKIYDAVQMATDLGTVFLLLIAIVLVHIAIVFGGAFAILCCAWHLKKPDPRLWNGRPSKISYLLNILAFSIGCLIVFGGEMSGQGHIIADCFLAWVILNPLALIGLETGSRRYQSMALSWFVGEWITFVSLLFLKAWIANLLGLPLSGD